MKGQKYIKWVSLFVSGALFAFLVVILQKQFLPHLFEKEKAKPNSPQVSAELEGDEAFKMIIKGKLAEIQKCYNSELKRGAKKSGKLIIRWTVDANGLSNDFKEETNELESSELYDCATTAIQAWSFPKNRPIHIRYTFNMKALEKERVIREVSSLDELGVSQ